MTDGSTDRGASGAVDRWLRSPIRRLALGIFRRFVIGRGWRRHERERSLRSIQATVTYPVYAATTLLYASGAAVGLLLLWSVAAPSIVRPFVVRFAALEGFWLHGIVVGGGIGVAGLGAIGVYLGRWWYVHARGRHRAVLIDESLPRAVAFMYALSRSGMVYPQIFRTVAVNRHSFGESAEELATVIKDVDLFGTNVSVGLRRVGQDSPSDQFADFAENFANVLRSGRNVSGYLSNQYEQLQARRRDHQRRLLDLYAALGEAYVAVLVAGPLFLMTILIIFGLLTGGTVDALRLLVYAIIPLANLGFIVYLDTVSGPFVVDRVGDRGIDGAFGDPVTSRPAVADGGLVAEGRARNRLRLGIYDRLRRLRRIAARPVTVLVSRPTTVFYLTVPLALVGIGGAMAVGGRTAWVGTAWIDDLVVLVGLFLLGTFAIVQELHDRRIRQVEGAIPDLLDRLASANEAGMTFTDALKRVDRSDLGRLNVEVGRLISDMTWGARTERAMYRFAARVRSPSIVRVVALITNAMQASGQVGPVIRIAADEARQDHRLQTNRREDMFMYTIIIYLAFAVFLGIAVALRVVLIPAMPSGAELSGAVQGGLTGVRFPIDLATESATQAYLRLLFHGAVIQATCSGFVAGQMGEGRVRNGAKHATVLLVVAYSLFVVVL